MDLDVHMCQWESASPVSICVFVVNIGFEVARLLASMNRGGEEVTDTEVKPKTGWLEKGISFQ